MPLLRWAVRFERVIERRFVPRRRSRPPLENARKQRVEGPHQPVVRAERARQPKFPAVLCREIVAHAVEHGHVCSPEPIDALFGIADHKQPARRALAFQAAQRIDDRALGLIGILKFIDEDVPKLSVNRIGVACHHVGVMAQQRQRPRFQVVKIERPACLLEPFVGVRRTPDRIAPGEQEPGNLRVGVAGNGQQAFLAVSRPLPYPLQDCAALFFALFAAPVCVPPTPQIDFACQCIDRAGKCFRVITKQGICVRMDHVPVRHQTVVNRPARCGNPRHRFAYACIMLRLGHELARCIFPHRPPPGQQHFLVTVQMRREPCARAGREGTSQDVPDIIDFERSEHFHTGPVVGRQLRQGQLHRVLAHNRGFGFIEHIKIRVERGLGGVIAQQRGAQRVNRPNAGAAQRRLVGQPPVKLHIIAAFERSQDAGFNRLPHAIQHFGGRFFREGDRYHRRQRPVSVPVQQGDKSLDQDARLAAASPRRDDHVAFVQVDGFALLIREVHSTSCLRHIRLVLAPPGARREVTLDSFQQRLDIRRQHGYRLGGFKRDRLQVLVVGDDLRPSFDGIEGVLQLAHHDLKQFVRLQRRRKVRNGWDVAFAAGAVR